MSREPFVVLTGEAADKIVNATAKSGSLAFRHSPSEAMYVSDVVEVAKDDRRQVLVPSEYKALRWGDDRIAGQWVRKPGSGINVEHRLASVRGTGVTIPWVLFKELVPEVVNPGNNHGLVITHDPDLPENLTEFNIPTFAAWLTSKNGVAAIPLAVEPKADDLGLAQLGGHWPVDKVQDLNIAIIGVGSIGGAVAQALAAYGVGNLNLIDPDRFLWHNMVRHILGPESVGRLKVDALRDHIQSRWPKTTVAAYPLDVAQDAHLMRTLFKNVDLIVCAADGVAPRRVVSHLARRANKPAVLACVLENGAIGEVIRLQPAPRYGCLLCVRAHLQSEGAIDVEAVQELGYGTGTPHLPMTAVGPDLHLVGHFTAKVAVATILETRHGDHAQRLPGSLATVGLRPPGDMAAPYDLRHATEVKWTDLPRPRTDCPTCNP